MEWSNIGLSMIGKENGVIKCLSTHLSMFAI